MVVCGGLTVHCGGGFAIRSEKVFEWDQTLEEVNMYINLPPNVPSKQFYCKIQSKHVELGIKGNPPYLNHDLTCPVKTDSSFWTLEDDIMHITLQKRDKGQTWSSPILGQGELDPYASDLEQKRLMLQRFQEENPGFDFSQAQFTGNCPDPRTFMGGIHTG
uniref:CS domain-containing protein n=1 Tax=Fagus sylvatica TaxID=28930 RepID=A0A2N9EH54_FAGSY